MVDAAHHSITDSHVPHSATVQISWVQDAGAALSRPESRLIAQVNGKGSQQTTEAASFALVSDNTNGQSAKAPPEYTIDAQQVNNLIHGTGNRNGLYLGSDVYRQRERAHRDLIAMGAGALPHLFQAIGNPQTDLEASVRSRQISGRIIEQMGTMQLLSLRNPQTMTSAIENGLNHSPSQAEQNSIAPRFTAAINGEIASRLRAPDWLESMNYSSFSKKLGGFLERVPTEETVRQWDRMATDEGRRAVTQRLGELTQMLGSGHLTDKEREVVSSQIQDLGRVSSPATIQQERLNSRMALAMHLQNNQPGSDNRVHQLVMQAYNMAQGQNRDYISQQIVSMNLDQNPAFMQRFTAAGGDAQSLTQIRESIKK